MSCVDLSLAVVGSLFVPPASRADEARFFRIVGPGTTAMLDVTADGFVTWTNELTNVTCTVQTARMFPDDTNWVDYIQVPVSSHIVSQRLFDLNPPADMVLIPAGSFTMGNAMDPGEGVSEELPLHSVYVSGFYMSKYEVTKALWDEVYQWATNYGYSFSYGEDVQGKAANHPANTVTWFDAAKWCNARSEKEGLTPAYYTGPDQTTVYRSGGGSPQNDWVKWNTGYRLPTEAEWEKAARGGVSGHRFSWLDPNTISHSRANYVVFQSSGTNAYPYDVSPTSGAHPTFNDAVSPYTSPVGYFAANGYGLYDMTGNQSEWCWDCHDSGYYNSSPGTDPQGPTCGLFGSQYRVLRGGNWLNNAYYARVAFRGYEQPSRRVNSFGFRCVLANP